MVGLFLVAAGVTAAAIPAGLALGARPRMLRDETAGGGAAGAGGGDGDGAGPGRGGSPSRPSPSDGVPAGVPGVAPPRNGSAGRRRSQREAEASLRIEHWRDGEHRIADRARGAPPCGRRVDRAPLGRPARTRRPSSWRAVADELGLHPLIAEDILERNQRPKLELTDGHAHLVVFAVAWERELLVEEIDIVLAQPASS